ncbi:MAG: SIS domain-containing protein [Candidatus Caldatribacterium sp.]|nr:SIS domain-containing protein [Candidatus Caldatribacterium sp.]
MPDHTYHEIRRQPITWREVLGYLESKREELLAFLSSGYKEALFAGCGSSYNLALTAAYLWQKFTRERARGVPSSEVFLFPEGVFLPEERYLFVGISRSGETTETVKAVAYFKEHFGGKAIGITCQEGSSLARLADCSIVLSSAAEQSVVMTQSFSSMLLALLFLAMAKSGMPTSDLNALPETLELLISRYEAVVKNLAEHGSFTKFIFLGNGPLYGIAWEGSLKLKEMSLTPTETFHFLEFRHGPKSIVDEETLLIALTSQSAFDMEKEVILEMVRLGATVLHLGLEHLPSPKVVEVLYDEKSVSPIFLPLLDVVFLQLLGYFRAKKRGLDPDNPKNLTKVVVL